MFRLGKSRGQRISAYRNHTLRALTPDFLTHSEYLWNPGISCSAPKQILTGQRENKTLTCFAS